MDVSFISLNIPEAAANFGMFVEESFGSSVGSGGTAFIQLPNLYENLNFPSLYKRSWQVPHIVIATPKAHTKQPVYIK